MRKGIFICIFALLRFADAQDTLHVYYYGGETIEQKNISGVTVTMSVKDNGRFNQVAMYVDNRSSESVNVIPGNVALHQGAPKEKDLTQKPDQEVQRIGGHNALGHMVSGVGAGLGKLAGKDDSSSGQSPPDYDAQAHWLAHADELAQKGQTVTLAKSYLRSTTVFPGSRMAGVLWFDREDAFASGVVHVVLGARIYEFPFPPPEWATTPSNPGKPDQTPTKTTTVRVPSGRAPVGGSKHGVLGVEGEDWTEGGIAGVRIENVAENSSAAAAGLHIGNVITELDGNAIRSTDDLAAALAQKEPGSRVNVTYLFHTNLGWMAKQATLILARGE